MLEQIQSRVRAPDRLFLLVVVLPVAIATLYFGLLASDIYVSESRFVVRSPEKGATSGLGVFLKSAGFTNASDEIDAVESFVVSRAALAKLNRNDAYERAYSQPQISSFDRFNPTGFFGSFEHLFEYYKGRISLKGDSTTSILTLTVEAYDPVSAKRFNEQLLQMSEAMVNRLNERGRQDLVQYASNEVQRAQVESRQASAALAGFRNRSGVIDPEQQAQIQLQMISKLQDELIASRTLLAQLRQAAPENPQIPGLLRQISSLEREMAMETAKTVGGNRSLANSAVSYQRLQLESEFAEKQLGGALASLAEAQNEARRKQAYVERIVEPNLPDDSTQPRRLRGILAVLIVSLIVYAIARMLIAGVREHAQ